MASLISMAPLLTVLPPVGLYIPLWPWISWNLWKARNQKCFENRVFSGMKIVNKSISDTREWQSAQLQSTLATTHKDPHATTPPTATTQALICNVDAAWDSHTGNCGIGGLFSCSLPRTIPEPIRSLRTHVSSALMAETLAIRSAVMHAASLNIKSLMILSDSLSLIKLMKGRSSVPALFDILFDIYHFSSLFDVISFAYVPRLSNVVADSVARSALTLLTTSSL